MDKNRILKLEGAENIRELGGYKTSNNRITKYNKLLRAANIANLTSQDILFIKDYGLNTIVDFRSSHEQKMAPNVEIEGVRSIHIPIFAEDSENSSAGPEDMIKRQLAKNMDPKLMMIDLYKKLVTDPHSLMAYKHFFGLLLSNDEENEVLLFHCNAGKDRTGFAAALFLSALAVDCDTIFEDYRLTNENLHGLRDKITKILRAKNAPEKIIDSVKYTSEADPDYLQAAFTTIEKEYNSMEEYFYKALDLGEDELIRLSEIYSQDLK